MNHGPILECQSAGAEGDLEGGFYVDGSAVFCGGLELPARDGLAGEAVQAVVDAAEDSDVAYGAVGVNHGVEDDRAGDILAHDLEGIGGIDFAHHCGGGEVS